MENNISIEIPADVQVQVLDLAKQLNTLLAPYMVALTPEQRQSLPKMGDKTVAFVEKAITYCELKPDFAPRYLNVEELRRDFAAVKTIQPLLRLIKPLAENLDDTLMICGSEAYVAALTYYNSVKEAARRNTADATAIADDLRQRFPHSAARKEELKTPAAE